MTDTHVTNGAGTPEAVTSEHMVTRPKRDRAEYMRDYRARQNNKSNNPELNSEIIPETAAKARKEMASVQNEHRPNIPPSPAPELNSAAPAPEQKTTEAEKYEGETVPQADEAALALQRQIEELRKSEQINRQYQEQQNRQQQEQENYLRYLRQKFQYWKQAGGLTNEQEQFLLAGPPAVIDELTRFAAQQAVSQDHQAGSAEHEQAAQRVFHERLERLRQQVDPISRPSAENKEESEPAMQEIPKFFQPPPPKPARQQYVPVSAPVSREPPGLRRSELETDPRRTTLSVEERQIAKASGLSDIDYARGKLELQRRKAAGEIQG
jgi:hypothetical protein